MRTLDDLPLNLTLYDTVKRGGAPLGNMKRKLGATWRRSIRSVGGHWMGTASYSGQPFEMRDLFLSGLGRELREYVGGALTWQGFITRLELTLNGLTYIRDWLGLANRVQVIYTKLGDNLFTNGSVETGIWAAYNSPTTLAQSTSWISDGSNSAHIVADANNGAIIQTGITIVASKAYDCQVAIKVVSGTWKLEIYRTDTGASLGSGSENNTGQRTLRASIANTNTYAGTIGVRLYSQSAAAEIYADGATFRETALQARTSWYADTLSPTDYGTLEMALLQAGMSDATANGHAQTALAEQKWARTLPPDAFGGGMNTSAPDGLLVTVCGYAWSLRNKYVISSRAGTTQNASTHITNLVGDSEFVTAGKIDSNTMQYQIDDRAPLRAWEVLRDITLAGDASGNRWTCGVYANRLFQYHAAPTLPNYHYRSGKLLTLSGDAIEGWLATPGLVYLDDMPVSAAMLTSNSADDPHVAFVEEVEFDAAQWLSGGDGLAFRRQAATDQALGA